jgi:hypothetical protein
MQAHSTANEKVRREIQNHQMFETDHESFSPAIYFKPILVRITFSKKNALDASLERGQRLDWQSGSFN